MFAKTYIEFCFVTASRPEIAHGKFPAPREKFPARLLQGTGPQMTEMAHRSIPCRQGNGEGNPVEREPPCARSTRSPIWAGARTTAAAPRSQRVSTSRPSDSELWRGKLSRPECSHSARCLRCRQRPHELAHYRTRLGLGGPRS